MRSSGPRGALKAQWAALDAALPVRGGVSNSDVLRSYLGLLVQGKSDFDAIEGVRGDKFYKEALGIGLLPSSPTLRQRLDAQAPALFEHVPGMIERLLSSQRPAFGVLACGWLPLDVDTFAMDNGGTAKEGVGRTYAGVDGYCPLAQRLSAAGPKAPILARLDSGFDSAALMRSIEGCNQAGQPQVDWLTKWNPRSVDTAGVLARLDGDANTRWQQPRAGKRVTVWEEAVRVEGVSRPLRRILRLVERTSIAGGQQLIVPEVELEGWTTSLGAGQFDAAKIIALYADHGTHEQFHSEFKTDLDLERLPTRQVRHQLPGVPTGGAGHGRPRPMRWPSATR